MGRTGPDPQPRRLPRHLRNEDIPTQTFTPRTYQVELLDAALQQNTLVCVGGTSSRMFLSVMLLKELSLLLRSSVDLGGKRSVFLIEKEGDIEMYSQVIEHNTDLRVGQYTSTTLLDTSQWHTEIDNHHILVMTPVLFLHILMDKILSLSQISVLIFDDCHHVTKEHPYSKIVKILHDDVGDDLPRILGLTSCFVSSKCQDPSELGQTIQTLENQYKAVAETSTLVFSERYGIRPKEYVIECSGYQDKTGLLEMLGGILENTDTFLSECNIGVDDKEGRDPCATPRLVVSECLNILYRLGPWCAAAIAQMFVTQLEKIDKHESVDIHKKFLRYAATQLRLVINVFEQNFSPDYDVEELLQYTTPKVKKLIEHLRKFKPDYDFMIISSENMEGMLGDNDSDMSDDSFDSMSDSDYEDKSSSPKVIHVAVKKDGSDKVGEIPQLFTGVEEKFLCGIVFVDQRYMAFALNKFVEEVCSWDEHLCFIKSHHITGQAAKSSSKKGSKAYKKQEDILRKFRLQELNLLFANDVLEEGVDVPKCNLIVKFDPPKDYKSYSLSKGRARARDSDYVILMEKDRADEFTKELRTFKAIEEVLTGRWKDHSSDFTSDDLEESLYSDVLPPYIPCQEDGGPQVNLNTAIALVNRYCAKLPSDAFTHLTPSCTLTQDGSHITASLRLPINSPVKDLIVGIPMPTKQLAKKAVALKTCELLHKSGELDDQLMPVGKELFIKEEEDAVAWDMEDLSGEARPGTTKRKQYYFKQLGASLVDNHPKPERNFLYILNMTLTTPISDDQNTRGRRVYAPEETCRSFGLLSSKYIPKIPVFPVYTRSGEVTASIDLIDANACFTTENLTRLQEFHRFIFSDVLRLEKDPMDFSPERAGLGYLVIPLNRESLERDYSVDWDFIDLVKKSKSLTKRNIYDSSREIFEFKKEEYEDAVVMPSYRNIDQPQHFYVAEIRGDLNPSSTFPSPELYKTFSQYYTTKYGLTVTNQEQPLLDVDHTSARLNLLTPRYMNQKGVALPTSSAETKKARRENLQQKQILVPELCEVHVIPASLWRKAVCLPTILYRMNYLLVAEEIRITISRGAHIGQVELPENFSFPPLDFGFSLQEDNKDENAVEDEPNDEVDIDRICAINKDGCEIQNDIDNKKQDPRFSEKEADLVNDDRKSRYMDESVVIEIECDENKWVTGKSEMPVESSQPSGKDCILNTGLHIRHDISEVSKQTCDKIIDYADDSIQCNGETGNNLCDDVSVNDFTFQCSQTAGQGTDTSHINASSIISELKFQDDSGIQTKNGYVNNLESNFVKLTVQEIHKFHKIETLASSCSVPENPSTGEKNKVNNASHVESKVGSTSLEGRRDISNSDAETVKVTNDQMDYINSETEGKISDEAHNKEVNDHKQTLTDMWAEVEHFGETRKIKPSPQKLSEIPFPTPLLSLDDDIDLSMYVGPSPCTILQALTMSNANDFFSLERLETIGDSFLKYAITVYLYCTYPGIHEGKLSYLRSKQVSNCNLYRLGKRKRLAECMISTKFEPYENWLPPGFVINEDKRKGPVPKVLLAKSSEIVQDGERVTPTSEMSSQDTKCDHGPVTELANNMFGVNHWTFDKISPSKTDESKTKAEEEIEQQILDIDMWQDTEEAYIQDEEGGKTHSVCSYSLQTLHSIPDKSIADCVESLIGCYLTSCGKKAALQFMSWLGLKVLPPKSPELGSVPDKVKTAVPASCYPCPPSPLLQTLPTATKELEHLLIGYDQFEATIGYRFRDRAYLLQAFTHASYHYNTITDCYQRLEFLGDAILDYVITRHLYEDSCKYSPGVLTDLRSALVNNNIFAALAVKWDFHKYFKAISPPLFQVINKFVARQKEREDEIDLEDEDDEDHTEEYVELEVPKALGDIFESVAGAIYLDSGLSLDVVWGVYYRIMKPQIDKYLKSIPKSPVRELLEMEPETAKFEKPERTLEGKIRVTVNVVSKGVYVGIGRNYRIAKSAAAKKALRCIKNLQAQGLI